MLTRKSLPFLFGHKKGRVDHAEWLEEVVRQVVFQLLARGSFDDRTEHINRDAVSPLGTGILLERNPGELLYHFLHGGISSEDIHLPIHFRDFASDKAIAITGGMTHQVGNGGFSFCRSGFASFAEDDGIREFGKVTRDWIFESELSLLDELHGGCRGDRFRHRVDPKNCFGSHRFVGVDVS